jgi:DNA-binding SARP family transcriptional activator
MTAATWVLAIATAVLALAAAAGARTLATQEWVKAKRAAYGEAVAALHDLADRKYGPDGDRDLVARLSLLDLHAPASVRMAARQASAAMDGQDTEAAIAALRRLLGLMREDLAITSKISQRYRR